MSGSAKWRGDKPETCEMCGGNLGSVFYDAKIPSMSPLWGLLCHSCFTAYGCKLGTGQGQKYDTKTLNKVGG